MSDEQKAKGKRQRQKAKGKRQKAKGKRQKAKGKRQKAYKLPILIYNVWNGTGGTVCGLHSLDKTQ